MRNICFVVEEVFKIEKVNNGLRLKRNWNDDRFLNTFRYVEGLDSFAGVLSEFKPHRRRDEQTVYSMKMMECM